MQHDDSCAKCVRMKNVSEELIEKLSDVATFCDKAKTLLSEQMTCDSSNCKKNCIIIAPYIVR